MSKNVVSHQCLLCLPDYNQYLGIETIIKSNIFPLKIYHRPIQTLVHPYFIHHKRVNANMRNSNTGQDNNKHERFESAVLKVSKGCTDQELIQSSTTPDPGYQWESDKLTVRHHKREPKRLSTLL